MRHLSLGVKVRAGANKVLKRNKPGLLSAFVPDQYWPINIQKLRNQNSEQFVGLGHIEAAFEFFLEIERQLYKKSFSSDCLLGTGSCLVICKSE